MAIPFAGKGAPLSEAGLDKACTVLQCDLASIWSLMTVETRGFGFLQDRRPKILYERHVFHRLTKGSYDSNPNLSSPNAGGYVGGEAEYNRLEAAMQLDQDAALQSVSWGLGQIMGFNAKQIGYTSALDMATRFGDGEHEQLYGVVQFIRNDPQLLKALQSRDWKQVAYHYNGEAYMKNEYDLKLGHFYERYEQEGCPDLTIRETQALLTYLQFDPHGIDGFFGKNSLAAMQNFQRKFKLPVTAKPDAATLATLRKETGF